MAGLALALGALNGPAALKSPAALLSIAKTKTAGRSLHAGSDGPAQFAEPGFLEALTRLAAAIDELDAAEAKEEGGGAATHKRPAEDDAAKRLSLIHI